MGVDTAEDSRGFWLRYQPGFRFADAPFGSKEFFDQVSAYRYALEPHISDVVQFERWCGADVLEAGCGIGTDGARLAAAGARYTGVDFSPTALELARRRFELEEIPGRFLAGSVTHLPFVDESFDLVFSHGVIHHVHDTQSAVREFHRVLRPGGTVLIMVYHRRSFNYYVSLMLVRRAFIGALMVPKATSIVSRITREPEEVVAGHRELLREHGIHYVLDTALFLSNNTDGPYNPLSKVYSRREARDLLAPYFAESATDVRYLNLRLYPGGPKLASTGLGKRLARVVGWHLYIQARKAADERW